MAAIPTVWDRKMWRHKNVSDSPIRVKTLWNTAAQSKIRKFEFFLQFLDGLHSDTVTERINFWKRKRHWQSIKKKLHLPPYDKKKCFEFWFKSREKSGSGSISFTITYRTVSFDLFSFFGDSIVPIIIIKIAIKFKYIITECILFAVRIRMFL